MARLWSCGFELNSTTANVEFTSVSTGSPSIQTSVVRTGTYAGRSNPTANIGYFLYTFSSSTTSAVIYARAYIRFASFPAADTDIIALQDSGGTGSLHLRFINATSKLRLRDNGSVTIGSDSAALSLNTWYRVEVMQGDTATTMKASLDGTEFASSTGVTAANVNPINQLRVGIQNSTTADMFMDDIAVNDDTGSVQTGYPGDGSIVHLRPSAAGDNTGWTPLSGSNFANVQEVTPNDATDGVRAATAPHLDDYNIDDPSGTLDSNATVNVIQVGVRYDGGSATQANNPKFKVRFKASSGGTVSESAEIQPAATAYVTNANAAPRNYPLTLYQNPDTTTITSTTLTSSQIGVNLSTTGDGTNVSRVSTIWALVDYTPGAGGTTVAAPTHMMMGMGS